VGAIEGVQRVTDHSDLLQIARDAVALGADMVKNTRPRHIREKSDRDIVTDVDIEVERAVRNFLDRETPDIDFLGEEEGPVDRNSEYIWTLDPIDGTSNFAHGLPLCATQLALLHRNQSIIAAITAPFLQLQYHAAENLGAFCNDKQIYSSHTGDLSKAIVSVGDYATGRNATEKNLVRLRINARLAEQVERVRMFGSAAIDLAWVAEGRTDAAIILGNKPWDTAPGVLLVRQAGAAASDIDGNPHVTSSPSTVAANSDLLSLALKMVAS
jgi:myo-inositol-1(or 4)-monophosphatase